MVLVGSVKFSMGNLAISEVIIIAIVVAVRSIKSCHGVMLKFEMTTLCQWLKMLVKNKST